MFLSDPGSFIGGKTEKESPEELMLGCGLSILGDVLGRHRDVGPDEW